MSHVRTNQFTEVAEVYDSLMSVVPYTWWVDYVQRLWKLYGAHPRRVLDLACGTGTILRELARRGYEAEGVDASEAMLAVARRKLPPAQRLFCQDARAFVLPTAPFDACVCLFDSLNYLLDDGDLRRAFGCVRDHLVPGGIFVFDMNAIRALETGMFDQRGTGRDASLEYEWQSAWQPDRRLCTIRMEFQVHDGVGTRCLHETHVQRGYSLEEVTEALRSEGYAVLAAYDAFTTRPPTAHTDRFYVVARTADGGGSGARGPAE